MSLIRHPIVQYAYFVKDVDESILKWVNMFGAGPFLKVPRWSGAKNHLYRGQPTSEEVTHAHGQCGPVQIQLTQQHDDKPSIWRDVYPDGGEGFHHVAIIVEDFAAERQRFIDAGASVGEEFHYDTVEGTGHLELAPGTVLPPIGRVAYMDARGQIGCFVELLEKNPITEYEFAAVRKLHESWDGKTDPIRLAV